MFWENKVIVITGGSSGLGKELAQAFGKAGGKVVIAALEPEIVDAAVTELQQEGVDCSGIACNVTSDEDVEKLKSFVLDKHGKVDVLVNVAGRTDRGKMLDWTADKFEKVMKLNFFALVRVTHAFLPELLKTQGRIINIGSLASKSASRWTGAYPTSKHAVAAYSQQLRLELGSQGLKVLLVCPGPIARETERLYPLEGLEDLPESARRPGAGVKVKKLDPKKLVAAILKASEKGLPELVMPWKARLLFAIQQLFPRLGDWLVQKNT